MSKVLDFANKRLDDEIKERNLGADNQSVINYWLAYRDGANAMQREWNRSVMADNLNGNIVSFVGEVVGLNNTITSYRSEMQLKATSKERKDELADTIKKYRENIETYEVRIAKEFEKITSHIEKCIGMFKADNKMSRGYDNTGMREWRGDEIRELKKEMKLINELKEYYEDAKVKINNREIVEDFDCTKGRAIKDYLGVKR